MPTHQKNYHSALSTVAIAAVLDNCFTFSVTQLTRSFPQNLSPSTTQVGTPGLAAIGSSSKYSSIQVPNPQSPVTNPYLVATVGVKNTKLVNSTLKL